MSKFRTQPYEDIDINQRLDEYFPTKRGLKAKNDQGRGNKDEKVYFVFEFSTSPKCWPSSESVTHYCLQCSGHTQSNLGPLSYAEAILLSD